MTGNPKPGMGSANQVLDKIPDKKRGTGVVVSQLETYFAPDTDCLIEAGVRLLRKIRNLPSHP